MERRSEFLAYFILSLTLLLPAVATLLFHVVFVFSLVTSTTASGGLQVQKPVDPVAERLKQPRDYLALSALVLVPYTLFNLVAFIGVGVGWKCLSGESEYLHPRARKIRRLVLFNLLAGALAVLYSAGLGVFSIRTLSWIIFLVCFTLIGQLGVTSVISGSASCDCGWDKYVGAMKFFHQLAAAANLGGCMLGIYVSLSSFFSNEPQFKGGRVLKGAILCNTFVLIIGVPVTALVNRAMFLKNDQDLGNPRVFAAAFEQTFLSLCLLSAVVTVEGALLWLLRSREADGEAVSTSNVTLNS